MMSGLSSIFALRSQYSERGFLENNKVTEGGRETLKRLYLERTLRRFIDLYRDTIAGFKRSFHARCPC